MNILKSSNNLWNNFWFFSPSAAAHRFNFVAREKKVQKKVWELNINLNYSLYVWSSWTKKNIEVNTCISHSVCLSLFHSNSYPHLIFIIFMFYLRHLLDIPLVFSLSVLSAENVLHVLPFTLIEINSSSPSACVGRCC